MALSKSTSFAGVTVPGAYHRIDRVVIEHKQSIFAFVNVYADKLKADARESIPAPVSYTFPWPVDGAGNPLPVLNPVYFAYTEVKKLPAYAGAADV